MRIKDGTIMRAVKEYCSDTIDWVEVIPDPHVPGVFAVRAQQNYHGGGLTTFVDFLVRVPLQTMTADDLEEVEFTTWPPEAKS